MASFASAPPYTPPILTAEAMREADRRTIEEYGVPSFTLMESAGRGAAHAIRAAYGPLDAALILCGKGNNGGDGLVVARQLVTAGIRTHVVLTADPSALRDDPAQNWSLLQSLAEADDRLTLQSLDDPTDLDEMAQRARPDVTVDALLGTGLTSDLRAPIDAVVDWLNAHSAPTVALDVPTGLHSDTGALLGDAVRADRTVTMAAPKAGMVVGHGPEATGSIDVVEIGIPPFILDEVADAPGCMADVTPERIRQWWPERPAGAYKYSVGMALVVGGSTPFAGAPTLAARAAERMGAGYVSAACPAPIQSTLSGALPTVPTHGLPTTNDGVLDPDAALDRLASLEERAAALLVGPGLGRAPGTEAFVKRLLQRTDCPTVVDADGLNALADDVDILRDHAHGHWILTPHEGEFRRLAGDDVDLTDRVRTVQQKAQAWNCVLVLKGTPSIAAGPDGRTFVSRAGTSALATAGTGDVLAGQCAGLLAQGVPPLEAAAAALYLGGRTAERYAAAHDGRSMIATDLLDALPATVRDVVDLAG